jgi:hypothetical protein
MGIYRTQQRLNNDTSTKSTNTDTFLKVNLDGKERLLPPDQINKIVNVGERFNTERQTCNHYRILGTINATISNVLFNLDNNTNNNWQTWKGFNELVFVDTSYPKDGDVADSTDVNYVDSIKRFLKEVNGWFGYNEPDKTKASLCNFYDMEPTRNRFSFIPDINPYQAPTGSLPVNNWELTITYPHNSDTGHTMVNGGLMVIEAIPVIVATKSVTAFGVACLHNLNIGDTVKINGTTGYDGVYNVIRTGLDNGDYKDYYFVVDVPTSGSIGSNSRMKRIVSDKESEYYFRVFKKIKTISTPIIEQDDYETYKLSFSENIYTDPISQFVFNEDVDISDLVDNLGRPLSELYLTKIKTSSNGLFTQITTGIETPFIPELKTSGTNTFLQSIPAINLIHNGIGALPFQSHIPLETNITINDTYFYGDLVEYNMYEVQETILADISHRFNTFNRETTPNFSYIDKIGASPILKNIDLGPRQEGYFYKAHELIKIREFSTYIEQGDSSTEGIPTYAVNLGDGRYLWRDLLDIGYNQSDEKPLDYPFLNGCHYMYTNDCFLVRRQDAFDNWGLYYYKFPADPLGERMTDKFTTNTEEDAC